MRKNLVSIVTLAAAVFFSTAIINAQDAAATTPAGKDNTAHQGHKAGNKDFGRKFGKRGMHNGDFRGVTLTDAQKAQIKTIREANKPTPTAMEEMKTLMAARRSGTLTDEQKARLEAIRTERMQKQTAVRTQIDAILTPEQKAQIEANKAERQKRMQEHREMMKERRQKKSADAPAAPAKSN